MRSTPQRVLVIGAGISGLAAAHRLANGGHDVLVIEAQDRIGGRIDTSAQWTDAPVDLGASWIHGIENNPIARIAQEIGAQTVATDADAAETYGVDGEPLDGVELIRLQQLQNEVSQAIVEGQDAEVDRPLSETITEGVDFDQLPPRDQRYVSLIMSEIEQDYAGSVQDLSTYWFDDGEEFGGDEVVFPQGYRVITDYLAKNLTVELGQTVTGVAVQSGGVTVTTQKAVFSGDRAIVTLPLGVLKTGNVQFTPGLPQAMQEAVETLEMGVLNKAYLRFPAVFWPNNLDWMVQVAETQGEWTNWLNIHRAVQQPILMGFNAANFGREIEALSDAEIVAAGMERLRSIFGNGIPDPVDFQITRWASNPYSWGSYSFLTTGSHPSMRDALAGNIEGRVFFAGEAANRQHASTVHGAYLSGIAAADAVDPTGRLFVDGFESGDTSAWSAEQS